MMKKVMLKQRVSWLFLCMLLMAVAAQAEVFYEDSFDNDGLGTNAGVGGGMINNTINRSHEWVDDGDLNNTSGGTHYLSRAIGYTENAFQSGAGFKLTVYYTIETMGGAGANKFSFGLISDDTDLAAYGGQSPFYNVTTTYALGVEVAAENQAFQGLNFTDGSSLTTLDTDGDNVSFVAGVSTPVVIEIDGNGNWRYEIDGVEEAAGTIDGGFDLSKSYHVVVYGQDDQYDKSVQSIKLETLGPGLSAHTPVPANNSTIVTGYLPGPSPDVTEVSWYSPLQDSDGNAVPDTNVVSVDGYDVYWSVGVEPNYVTDTPDDNGTSQSYTPTTPIAYDTTYFWRVDTTITVDSNSVWDLPGTSGTVEGSTWSFTVEPMYKPPVLTMDDVITTLDLDPAVLSAAVTNNTNVIVSVDFDLLEEDAEFPAGSDAAVTDTTIDNQNPTAELSTTYDGNYKVKLVISDDSGDPNGTQEAIAAVQVYADACQAIKDAPSTWSANYYDRDGDCLVNLGDFDELAAVWLDSTELAAQAPYTNAVGYVPADLFAIKREAEDIDDPNDPNYFSGGPTILDDVGIRINDGGYPEASDGKCLSNGTNGWVAYDIDVPVAAVGVPVDLYIGYSRASGTGSVSLGTEVVGEEDLYGTVSLGSTGNWGTFSSGVHTLTFTASGVQKFKFTMVTPVNLDWFVFDWPE